MRVLLASNASYDPPKGGSTRGNLAWLGAMAEAGHRCRVVCQAFAGRGDAESSDGGISIRTIANFPFHARELGNEIHAFSPDWVLVSSEDLSHVLLREAARAAANRLIYLAHTPQFYPFGPESWNRDRTAADIVRNATAVIAIGHHTGAYCERHLARPVAVIHPPIYGSPPYRKFGRFGDGFILMINPCAVKGLSIFLELAGRFPEVEFAALDGWGTTEADREAIRKTENARLLSSVPNIEDVLSQARLLLMPSLWYEGFGLIAMEAMLRGLPVVASDSGGLREAKGGTGYVIPVEPITAYQQTFDEMHMPVPVLPRQDVEPFARALGTLLHDEEAYWREAEISREKALQFVTQLDARELGRYLERLPAPEGPAKMDAARRALLLKRLREKR